MKIWILSDLNKLVGGNFEDQGFIDEIVDFIGILSEKVVVNSKLVFWKLLY